MAQEGEGCIRRNSRIELNPWSVSFEDNLEGGWVVEIKPERYGWRAVCAASRIGSNGEQRALGFAMAKSRRDTSGAPYSSSGDTLVSSKNANLRRPSRRGPEVSPCRLSSSPGRVGPFDCHPPLREPTLVEMFPHSLPEGVVVVVVVDIA